MSESAKIYRVVADISDGARTVPRVKCDITVSKLSDGPISVRCWPNHEQEDQLHLCWQISLRADLCHPSRSGECSKYGEVTSTTAYIERRPSYHRSGDFLEHELRIAVNDLTITRYLQPHLSDINTCQATVWLTPSSLFAPIIRGRSCHDDQEAEPIQQESITLANGVGVSFANQDVHVKHADNSVTRHRELIANIDAAKAISDFPDLFADLERLLLVGSLAERKAIRHTGWSMHSTMAIERYYRRDIWLNSSGQHSDYDEPLIPKPEFGEFLQHAYDVVRALPQPELVRLAINGTLSVADIPLEVQYVGLFSALESLVLRHRKLNGGEVIVPKEKWDELQPEIKAALKSAGMSKDERCLMYEKIPELNRPAFSRAYRAVREGDGWEVGDLWPVVDNKEGPSLSCIRNRIAHGDSMNEREIKALSVATIHLRWVLERALLATLKWPPQRSAVSENSLKRYGPYNEWRELGRTLSLGAPSASSQEGWRNK